MFRRCLCACQRATIHVDCTSVLEKLCILVRHLYSSLTRAGYLRLDEIQFA